MSVEQIRHGVEDAISKNNTAKDTEWATRMQIDRIASGVVPLAEQLGRLVGGFHSLDELMGHATHRVQELTDHAPEAHGAFDVALTGAQLAVHDRVQTDLTEADNHDVGASVAIGQMDGRLKTVVHHLQLAMNALQPQAGGEASFSAWHELAQNHLDAAALARERANVEARTYVAHLSYGTEG